jgi:beta-glucosidase
MKKKLQYFLTSAFRIIMILVLMVPFLQLKAQTPSYPFQNPALPFDQRVTDLVSRLTLQEKIKLMQNQATGIPRLGIPAYNWWNECLHGIARDGLATVFPQAIGMAATWNSALIQRQGDVVSTEGRAKHQEHIRKGEFGIYQGLTFWTPNINIFRDPRWGRGQETYGEDPFLTSRIGISYVKGLQGNDPKYFKVIATAKHFAVHSGPEPARHSFDATCSKQDLYETYLPAFEALVKEGKVYSLMGAYNRLYGTPCCNSNFLLTDVLRKKWGFKGYVVSDCGAIEDVYRGHKTVPSAKEASALAVLAGCDLTCGTEYNALENAVADRLINMRDIDVSVKRLFLAQFKLGMFDPASMVSYARIPYTENNSPAHDKLALDVAHQSMVLLKNNGELPLSHKYKKIAVIGPNADDTEVLLGNYNGDPNHPVSVLQGIRNKAGKDVEIIYERGMTSCTEAGGKESLAIAAAEKADAVIFVGGISPRLEGEEMPVKIEGFKGGDRTSLNLPKEQEELLKSLKATGKPVIFVLLSGSALSVNWENENLSAILEAWYPGQEGGNAVADVLFGKYNPAGRLPITFYKSVEDLPAFEDYSMKGRTYKYFEGKVLYPFGHGLSFSTFKYNSAKIITPAIKAGQPTFVEVSITNKSKVAGDEVVQVYATSKSIKAFRPVKALVGFSRVTIPAGKTINVKVSINQFSMRQFDESKDDYTVYPGVYELMIGASSSDIKLTKNLTIK